MVVLCFLYGCCMFFCIVVLCFSVCFLYGCMFFVFFLKGCGMFLVRLFFYNNNNNEIQKCGTVKAYLLFQL